MADGELSALRDNLEIRDQAAALDRQTIAILRARVAGLESEVAELRAHRDRLLQRNNITLQEKRDSEAALAEARKDTERLDWLDAKWWPYDQTYEEKINPDDDILLEVRRDRRKLRETIDAARREGRDA